MSNPLDTDAGSELFSSYEAELKLVQADLNQKLDQISEQSGEPRKSAIRLAERSLEEANELVSASDSTESSAFCRLEKIRHNFVSSSIKCVSRNKIFPQQPARA